MRLPPAAYPAAKLLALSLLLLTQWAAAGPVSGGEAASAPVGIEVTPALAVLPLDGPPTPASGGMADRRPGSGDTAPAGSALALELLKEAEAGAAANEELRRTPRPAAQSASAPAATGPTSRSQAGNAEADGGLREMGKAALHWLQESLPWLRDDPEDGDRRHDALPGAADWSESPLEGGKAGRGSSFGAMAQADGSGLAQAGPDAVVGYGSTPRNTPEQQHNIISEFIRVMRMVLEHPMTWLIVSLFLGGGMAIRKFDRRPK